MWRSYDALKSMTSAPFWTAAPELRAVSEHFALSGTAFPAVALRVHMGRRDGPDASEASRERLLR